MAQSITPACYHCKQPIPQMGDRKVIFAEIYNERRRRIENFRVYIHRSQKACKKAQKRSNQSFRRLQDS